MMVRLIDAEICVMLMREKILGFWWYTKKTRGLQGQEIME